MRGLLALAALFLTLSPARATSPPPHEWSQQFSGPGNFDTFYDVAIDESNGDIVVFGRFENTVDFGGGPLVSQGFADLVLARYDSDGAHLWSQSFGTQSEELPRAVAIADNGDIVISGAFQNGTINFGWAPHTTSSRDAFLARFSSGGLIQWSQASAAGSSSQATIEDIAFDDSGTLFAAATYLGTVSIFGGSTSPTTTTDIAVAKLNSFGTAFQTVRGIGGGGPSLISRIAVDADGSMYMFGSFEDSANFGGGHIHSLGQRDAYVSKFSDGAFSFGHEWTERIGGPGWDTPHSIDVDSFGDVYMTGSYEDSVLFDGSTQTVAQGSIDAFLLKYDDEGNHVWSQSFGGPFSLTQGLSLDVDDDDILYVVGEFSNAVDFGGGTLDPGFLNLNWFLASYSSDGMHRWSQRFELLFSFAPMTIAARAGEDLVLGGGNWGSVDYGGGILTSVGTDALLAKYDLSAQTAAPIPQHSALRLYPNVPNPFNPSTTITFEIEHAADVDLSIYTVRGQLVRRLVSEPRRSGRHEVVWDGRDASGRGVTSGMYVYRVMAGGVERARKLVVVK